jgi:acetate kinase
MGGGGKNILSVNGGSSSIKFSVYEMDEGCLCLRLKGKIDRIGLEGAELTYTDSSNKKEEKAAVDSGGAGAVKGAADFLLKWLEDRFGPGAFSAIGHRVVHGARRREPALVDEELLEELRRISGYDPDHLPGEIELMRMFRDRGGELPQVACFDTAFHVTMPRVATLMPLPRRYEEAGVQRYGFHGLSYAYLAEELVRVAGPEVAGGRVIMAHLGGGASLAAVRGGQSLDTTMGFTPTGGVMMGTRSGDLDPGVIWWILQQEGLGPQQLSELVNHQSGLLGVSGISSDMRDLLSKEGGDERAAEAVEMFCYQVRKSIGAFSAVLGGLDSLVFSGGIGERAPAIRSRVCAGLGYLGIGLDQGANERNEMTISEPGGAVRVFAIPTDEELMIARQTVKLLGL